MAVAAAATSTLSGVLGDDVVGCDGAGLGNAIDLRDKMGGVTIDDRRPIDPIETTEKRRGCGGRSSPSSSSSSCVKRKKFCVGVAEVYLITK